MKTFRVMHWVNYQITEDFITAESEEEVLKMFEILNIKDSIASIEEVEKIPSYYRKRGITQ